MDTQEEEIKVEEPALKPDKQKSKFADLTEMSDHVEDASEDPSSVHVQKEVYEKPKIPENIVTPKKIMKRYYGQQNNKAKSMDTRKP